MTLSLIGIRGEPKGIKATVYNREDAYEVGAFFHINPMAWFINENERKKKKSYKVDAITIIENYHLETILKKCGWDILKSRLVFSEDEGKISITGIKLSKESRSMEQVENILNSDNLFKYFQDKDIANED